MTMTEPVKEAVSGFIYLISKGWETETACLCMHDGVYDEVNIDCFIDLCRNAVKEEHIKVLK